MGRLKANILPAGNALLPVSREDWAPPLKALQEEVQKHQHCSYDSFQKHIEKVSHLAWERNPKLLNTYAHRELEKALTAKKFIEILYTYILKTCNFVVRWTLP